MNAGAAAVQARRPWTFRMTWTRVVLLGVGGLFVGVALYRFLFGLGASTNLNDRWPWGMWVWWDVLTGVALAGGGYSTALLVHFLGRERFRVVERAALLTSLLGYLMVCTGLLIDLGRWYRAWHPLVFWTRWNPHSVMWELFWCVGGYTVVQIVEFLPILTERVHLPRLARAVRVIYAPVLVVGIILPFLHQSALGSLFVITRGTMHPLWWSMLLPLFFLVSSFFVGPAMETMETLASARVHRWEPPIHTLTEMVGLAGWVMLAYLVLKVGDLVWRGILAEAFDGSAAGNLFLVELGVGVVVPMVVFLTPRLRGSRILLVTASALTAAGVAFNRANVLFTAMADPAGGASYVPHWMEVAVALGDIAVAVLVYLFIVENFPIVRAEEEPVAEMPTARGIAAPRGRGAVTAPGS